MEFVTFLDQDGKPFTVHASQLFQLHSDFRMELQLILDSEWRKVANESQAFIDDEEIIKLIEKYYNPK